MKKAFIISTGNELLLGTTQDTNSIYLSKRLFDLGIEVRGMMVVGDDTQAIKSALEAGLSAADIVITSGGLGPTKDDLTKDMACEVMGCQMELVAEELKKIKDYFLKRGRPMPESNIKQAMFPQEAVILKNYRGTAPGMYLKKDSKLIVLLPGPPHEMESMFLKEVEPRLLEDFQLPINREARRIIKVFGPGESQLEVMLGELMDPQQGYNMALTAKSGEIHIGLQVNGKNIENRQEKLDEINDKIKERIGNNIFGVDEDTLVGVTAFKLKSLGKKIAVAESCTGGLLAKMLTDLPGSSEYFWGGAASYSNEAKQVFLGVKEETLNTYGAVSRQTAVEMASGILERSRADVGAAITGIAGPSGGTDEKPVGLVYIAVMYDGRCTVRELRFGGQRDMIRSIAARTALDMVRRRLAAEEV